MGDDADRGAAPRVGVSVGGRLLNTRPPPRAAAVLYHRVAVGRKEARVPPAQKPMPYGNAARPHPHAPLGGSSSSGGTPRLTRRLAAVGPPAMRSRPVDARTRQCARAVGAYGMRRGATERRSPPAYTPPDDARHVSRWTALRRSTTGGRSPSPPDQSLRAGRRGTQGALLRPPRPGCCYRTPRRPCGVKQTEPLTDNKGIYLYCTRGVDGGGTGRMWHRAGVECYATMSRGRL